MLKVLQILGNDIFIIPCTGLLNRLTNKKEQSRGACSKCGYCKHFKLLNLSILNSLLLLILIFFASIFCCSFLINSSSLQLVT